MGVIEQNSLQRIKTACAMMKVLLSVGVCLMLVEALGVAEPDAAYPYPPRYPCNPASGPCKVKDCVRFCKNAILWGFPQVCGETVQGPRTYTNECVAKCLMVKIKCEGVCPCHAHETTTINISALI